MLVARRGMPRRGPATSVAIQKVRRRSSDASSFLLRIVASPRIVAGGLMKTWALRNKMDAPVSVCLSRGKATEACRVAVGS